MFQVKNYSLEAHLSYDVMLYEISLMVRVSSKELCELYSVSTLKKIISPSIVSSYKGYRDL